MATSHDLDNRFTYHPPKAGQPEIYQEIREHARALAHLVNARVPDGPEQATALAKIEESVFWANAGIARMDA
jgi:hypothetical protein